MSVSFKVKLDVARGIQRMTRSPNGLVGRRMKKGEQVLVRRSKDNVNRMGRVETGRMRDTIHGTGVETTGSGLSFGVVAPVRYAKYQHDGTRWITPAPFLTEALRSMRVRDFI